MSAYVVDSVCIHRILTAFERAEYRSEGVYAGIRPPRQLVTTDQRRELIRDLLRMNVDAVNCRYPQHPAAHVPPCPLDLPGFKRPSDWQCLKSLDCYLYQCSEGDVPERDLYQAVTTFRDRLRSALVCELPEYDAAEWG